jgi:hypothetical protein
LRKPPPIFQTRLKRTSAATYVGYMDRPRPLRRRHIV